MKRQILRSAGDSKEFLIPLWYFREEINISINYVQHLNPDILPENGVQQKEDGRETKLKLAQEMDIMKERGLQDGVWSDRREKS